MSDAQAGAGLEHLGKERSIPHHHVLVDRAPHGSEDTLVSNLRSKMVQLFVLELLIEGCARELGTAGRVALKRTTAAVVGKMY